LKFISFTNNKTYARALDSNSYVDSIFLDLEILGKFKRQGHTDSLISKHTLEDISIIRKVIKKNKLGVRTNPLNNNSSQEINNALKRGADVLMLPMFHKVYEVERFLELVSNRCDVDLLFETTESLLNIEKYPLSKIRKVHIGINDLSLEMKLPHLFYCFFEEKLYNSISILNKYNIDFGIGGVGHINAEPIKPNLILNANNILKSKRLILSRNFYKLIDTDSQEKANYGVNYNIENLINLNENLLLLSEENKRKLFYDLKNKLDEIFKKNI
tara:strand:- start:2509 stop:3324 length:816 start_codon:yes stop_codon:yes gene_type:complete